VLGEFWGRPVHLSAVVLLPEGFDEHPDARYPVLDRQGHFAATFNGFRTKRSPAGGRGGGPNAIDYPYKLDQDWSIGRMPHMLIVTTQDANPYYDDSYAVNSANLGPCGDAITQELYPCVEKTFRAIGQPWARVLYGGSTGGWEALAQQVFHPDYFNGAWVACPDPIDFHAFALTNLYEDQNAFYANRTWKQAPQPMQAHQRRQAALRRRRHLRPGTGGQADREIPGVHQRAGKGALLRRHVRVWRPRGTRLFGRSSGTRISGHGSPAPYAGDARTSAEDGLAGGRRQGLA
jgi:hypothetical protein